ncbi:hypothetical protein QFW77_05480 [Luteimonas sp. RD2P54]|uniref:DUF4124 domain-containing protein n=1 Tax=Luteimonas endophytica TaxID=3042023 RepID=A0ABT6J6L0_9GAMM|nr:hypothetical protein [Luteimonas endophytica]MDH5822441.1 hypothetical protein [Luteimonas endophytica]
MKNLIQIACLAMLLAPVAAGAQRGGQQAKRLYCWEEDGRKVCGDALPASAVDSARTEISAATGLRRAEVDRAMSEEERAAARRAAQQAAAEADAETAARRRDLAMVDSYATEDDLRRAYGERITLVEESVKTSRMGVGNLRQSLLTLLRQAAELELQEQPVRKPLLDSIVGQHADLLRQQTILEQQLGEQANLNDDLEQALERYREIKRPGSDQG